MTENVGELQALESSMVRLIESRNAVIETADAMVERANREFDSMAVELGKAINRARAASKPAVAEKPKRARKPKKEPVMDGLTENEKAAFRQMLKGKRGGN